MDDYDGTIDFDDDDYEYDYHLAGATLIPVISTFRTVAVLTLPVAIGTFMSIQIFVVCYNVGIKKQFISLARFGGTNKGTLQRMHCRIEDTCLYFHNFSVGGGDEWGKVGMWGNALVLGFNICFVKYLFFSFLGFDCSINFTIACILGMFAVLGNEIIQIEDAIFGSLLGMNIDKLEDKVLSIEDPLRIEFFYVFLYSSNIFSYLFLIDDAINYSSHAALEEILFI
ncbi:hypothetical protein ACJX0J_007402 [Zea mays]